MILSDFHCHTTFVDGAHSPEEVVLSAIEKGMKTLGISEHAHVPFDPDCSLSLEQTASYRAEIQRLKEKYQDKIQLLRGIEMDYYSEDDVSAYDYVIGSVHYLKVNGEVYSVDLSPDETNRCIQQAFGGDKYQYARCYFQHLAGLKEKWTPNIIGHFDLLTKFQERGIAFDEMHPVYESAACKAIRELKDCFFEVNTGAMSRGYRKEPYPAEKWLQEMKKQGGKVVLSSDSHHKNTLLYEFQNAKIIINNLGFTTAGFTDRKGIPYIQF